ncbi:SHOCT domain-containing protein [Aerococcus sp. L_32]|uniref:SHOCT domain-containing protein n=1 Tax=Aerococcus sp. L_32 TaxID=3422316 RepID=UPI003D6A72C1
MKMIQQEMNYQLALSLLKNLRYQGLITVEEYEKGRCILLEKYTPYIAELLYSNDLTI